MKYAVSEDSIHIISGIWQLKSIDISRNEIDRIETVPHEDGTMTLFFMKEIPSAKHGSKKRELASFEKVHDHQALIKLFDPDAATDTVIFETRSDWRPPPVMLKYVGSIYIALSLSFMLFAVDAKVLTQNSTEDRVFLIKQNFTTMYSSEKGYCFGMYTSKVATGSLVRLTISPIFKTVTDVNSYGESLRNELGTGLHGIHGGIYFLTYTVLLVSGLRIISPKYPPKPESSDMLYNLPLGMLIVSLLFWGMYW
jgi:hypothetical protein